MKKKWSLSILTVINILVIGFFVMKYANQIDLHRLFQEMLGLPRSLIMTIIALNLILMFFYGCRLSYLIDERLRVSFSISAVGYAANNLLPFRLGELLRIYFAHKKYHIAASRSLLAMLFERMSDLFSIGCLALVAIFLSADQMPMNKNLIIAGLSIPILFAVFGFLKRSHYKQKFQHHKLYQRYIQPLISELQNLLDVKKLLALVGYTILIWILTVSIFWIFFKYSLLQVNFSLLDAVCLTVCTSLSLAISTLPSSIGLFEAGITYYLYSVKHVDETTALALAFALHGLILMPQIICMCYFLLSKYKKANPESLENHLTQG